MTSSVKTTTRVGARPSTRSSPKIACSTTPAGASTVAATRSIASQARSGLLLLTFDIMQSRNPRNWVMAGGSSGYRAGLVRRQLTPGLTSLLPGTAGSPPFISFSISYPELDSAVRGPAASYVCFWHKADIDLALTNVCFEGKNGHDADVARCLLMTQSGHWHARGSLCILLATI